MYSVISAQLSYLNDSRGHRDVRRKKQNYYLAVPREYLFAESYRHVGDLKVRLWSLLKKKLEPDLEFGAELHPLLLRVVSDWLIRLVLTFWSPYGR